MHRWWPSRRRNVLKFASDPWVAARYPPHVANRIYCAEERERLLRAPLVGARFLAARFVVGCRCRELGASCSMRVVALRVELRALFAAEVGRGEPGARRAEPRLRAADAPAPVVTLERAERPFDARAVAF